MSERNERIKRGQEKRGKKKKSVWKIVVIAILALLLLIFGVAYGILKYYHSLLDYQPDRDPEDVIETMLESIEEESEDEPLETPASEDEIESLEQELEENAASNAETQDAEVNPVEHVYNLLLIGVDSRSNNFSGRSDTMILISINQENKKIVATSLLRDTYVSIPGRQANRLNASYAYGGMPLLKETIRVNYGIRVDRCVVVNFALVMDFVDALGGVDIHVSSAEVAAMNENIGVQNALLGRDHNRDKLPAGTNGMVHLNGQQAVGFARIRSVGNADFGRTERQREILVQCFQKIRGLSLGQMNDLAHAFLPRVRTDISEADCIYLLSLLVEVLGYEIDTLSLPISGSYVGKNIRGMSVLSVDFAPNTAAWIKAVTGGAE